MGIGLLIVCMDQSALLPVRVPGEGNQPRNASIVLIVLMIIIKKPLLLNQLYFRRLMYYNKGQVCTT